MADKKFSRQAPEFLILWAGWLLQGVVVMWAFSELHHDAHRVPAFGWVACVVSVIAVNMLANGIIYKAKDEQ